MLYEELLASCKSRFDEFFKNAPTFENHFTWNDYNEHCYRLMYKDNSYDHVAAVKELKAEIPELTGLCKNCGKFFIPARNKSIPKYDVILGKQLEEALMDFLGEKLGTVATRADVSNRSLPDCQILRHDGTTAAYFEVKFHGAPFVMALQKTGRYCYEGSATLDYKKIEKQLALIDKLDAPVFYVHWIEYPCLKGVFFETSDQVKKYISEQHELFEREKREGDDLKSSSAVYLKKMYSPLLDMQSFEAFMDFLRDLINNTIKADTEND